MGDSAACCAVDTSVSLPMPNLTLPSGLSVPLPNVSLPYMPSAGGTLPMSLTIAPTMPAVSLPAVGVSGVMPMMTATHPDAAAAAAAQRMLFCYFTLTSELHKFTILIIRK